MNGETGPSLQALPPWEEPGKIAGQPTAQILSGRTRKSGVRATGLCVSLLLSTSLVLGAAGRFEASVIEERRKGAEDLLRFTVHIPALNNSPQLKEFFQVCVPAQSPQHLGGLPAHQAAPCDLPPPPPHTGLSLLQGGEVTRPFEVSRDLPILPPPLIPTPPPDEPRLQPEEPWLPQPLPAERRGLEELEVPGT